jgi:hypothetical protein
MKIAGVLVGILMLFGFAHGFTDGKTKGILEGGISSNRILPYILLILEICILGAAGNLHLSSNYCQFPL